MTSTTSTDSPVGPVCERWLPVPGWEGLYEVSDAGRVRSLSRAFVRRNGVRAEHLGRILTPTVDVYPFVSLHSPDGARLKRRVHSLVMEAFVGPRPNGAHVRHLNGEPADNRLVNLTYGTPKENHDDMVRHGRQARGSGIPQARLDEAAVAEIRRLYATGGYRHRDLAEIYGVHVATVFRALNAKTWAHVDKADQLVREALELRSAVARGQA